MPGLPEPSRRASVKDVAAAAGVSLGTVSNVLNRPERVSAATRSRVEQAMAALRFVRNESARTLRAGHSSTLAYVMLDARNPFFTDVAEGIEQVAESRSLSLFLCTSDHRPAREAAHLTHLQQHQVQGVLVTPVDPDSPGLDDVVRRGTPLVLIDCRRAAGGFCSVSVDDVLGGRLAVEHLVDLGHQRIAFAGGPAAIGQVRDRLTGARTAWRDAQLELDDLMAVACDASTVEAGRAVGEQLAGMPRGRRPTAVFCANDLVALGLLQQAMSHGWTVPDDLAIVGYDDIVFAAAAAVPLTSVRQPREELGRTSARLVLDESDNPEHRHEQVVFTPTLVARASTVG
ncbi:LacI family DNA-binding transcriptional regulator [Luteimicrobium xylanilyticum]|uniref:Lactose operon repressor n=1 Tax=Luteimicrobium xylanilyticum TaxID=1133546 RepID=A0A5P9Q7Y6_9MICO|nr:LacI family DNA-binding transcriptional regulator [Luteimicrobium xylanilyticum]QFU97182.1 Lactose operon repressor [Luteimicrobium xylanilyticum]